MKIEKSPLLGLLVIRPSVFGDARGYFLESWNQERYQNLGIQKAFVQDNVSRSGKGVLRGLHFQFPNPQGKLVSVLEGAVFDVAVDVRLNSPTFGKWEGVNLRGEEKTQVYVPPGFAHGFLVQSEFALFQYKCTDVYHPESEKSLLWNDPEIDIDWQESNPSLSKKDIGGKLLKDFISSELPRYRP